MKAAGDALFSARTVAILLVIGVLGFIGTLVLGAYAPDLQSGRNGGGHALSNAATGYSAIVELARATGRNPRIVRDPRLFRTPDLLIATPERGDVNIAAAIIGRDFKPTLFVLPKWQTTADPERSDWVRRTGLLPLSEPIGVLAPEVRFTMRRQRGLGRPLANVGLPPAVALHAPAVMQVITGATFVDTESEDEEERRNREAPKLIPLITDGRGGIVLARLGDSPRFVLSDPDLVDNLGMKDVRQAAAALAMLDALDPRPDKGIAFDVSFNGLGRTQNPLKLALEPPFLAMTLTLAAALLLMALGALARFGPVVQPERAIAYGKTALVDNSAALVRRARREAGMGARYAAVIRERAARIFGAPVRVRDAALISYLDKLGGEPRFSDLAGQAEAATDRRTLLSAARALHAWQTNHTRGRQ
jgi:hypothetical protein